MSRRVGSITLAVVLAVALGVGSSVPHAAAEPPRNWRDVMFVSGSNPAGGELAVRKIGRRVDVRLNGRTFPEAMLLGGESWVPTRKFLEWLREVGALKLDIEWANGQIVLNPPPRSERISRADSPTIRIRPAPAGFFRPGAKGPGNVKALPPAINSRSLLISGLMSLAAGVRSEGETLVRTAALQGAPGAGEIVEFLAAHPRLGVLRVDASGVPDSGRLEVDGDPLENPLFGLTSPGVHTVTWVPRDPSKPHITRTAEVRDGSIHTIRLRSGTVE